MAIKIVYYYKLITHSGTKFVLYSSPDRFSSKILEETNSIEEVLKYVIKNQCLIKEI